MVREDTFFVVHAFMVNELGLSGNELMTYAIIYGFSQDNESWFCGTKSYLAEWCGCSKNTTANCLKNLLQKGYLERREKNVNGCVYYDYRALRPSTDFGRGGQNFGGGTQKLDVGGYQNLGGGVPKFGPHNIEDNIDSKDKEIYTCDALPGFDAEGGKKPRKEASQDEEVMAAIDSYTGNADLRAELLEFAAMRKRIKKPLTKHAIDILLTGKKGLSVLASTDDDKIEIVQKSVASSWLGFFPLNGKTDAKKGSYQNVHGDNGFPDDFWEQVEKMKAEKRRNKEMGKC